ncbi:hypothetical protein XELAEV_18026980mg [Xenopus laevis]|uniref:Rho-GAP domain-containing protein n=1 Tax=Xenopus laevis TaxID=8355 RepID=A0A974HJJ4_XENLA|nr:hypothetical protein XELAEV_18026980mg [Xenopus laevis]
MSWRPHSTHGVVLTAYHASNKAAAGSKATNSAEVSPRSRKSGQYTMNQGNVNPSLDKVAFNRSGSQDSLDELSLDDYWTEVENIKQDTNTSQEEQNVVKEPDEGELEEEWLKEAGLSNLFGECAADPQESIAFLSTLTRTQSAAVQKRIDTVTQTLRKKNKQHQIPDVRDVFKQPGNLQDKAGDINGFQSTESVAPEAARNIGDDFPAPVTDINLEISFAEQASNLKDFTRVRNEKEDDSLLPNFRLTQDKTGTTKIGDLALQDMKKVSSLALIELTALYDVLGTDLKMQRAAKIKVRECGLFRVPLSTLLDQDQKKVPGTRVPLIFQSLIGHIEKGGLDTEGILRIPGASSRIKALIEELEAKFYEGTFNWDNVKQHDAASLLKFFIRELPLPLLTVEYLKAFHSVQYLPSKKHRLQALNLLVILLPDIHRDTLKALLEFLQRVVDHKEQNKMILKNVAMIMAPNLFSVHTSQLKNVDKGALEGASSAARTASVMLFMIKYQNLLWTIPKFIVGQVRHQNVINQKKLTKEKAMKKLLKKMAYDREKSEKCISENDAPQGFIRVQAPQFSKVSMAVQLTEELKAGERCLEDSTYMKDLFQLNPNAEWVIKAKPSV